MNIHPMSGGVAPLYRARTPSFRTVCARQSSGPHNCKGEVGSLINWITTRQREVIRCAYCVESASFRIRTAQSGIVTIVRRAGIRRGNRCAPIGS